MLGLSNLACKNPGTHLNAITAALMCWQGTKACLGWDRDPEHGTYACTAVTDSWLLLLQRALHAARALQAAAQPQIKPHELRAQNSAPFDQQQQPVQPQRDTGTLAEAGRTAASHVGALQELLDQLLMHWQVNLLTLIRAELPRLQSLRIFKDD